VKMKSENEVSVIESSLDGMHRGLMLVLVMLPSPTYKAQYLRFSEKESNGRMF